MVQQQKQQQQQRQRDQETMTRKGPWTEQEDVQLVFYVNLFGDRRWDFIAKVSGLKRTGKSCRLRWVNYLHPGLKRGKMTPHEERLVLELHSKWGNRWSRIARKLPGRTDNEIKNYWRTHMRKKAQERKKAMFNNHSSSSSSSSSSASSGSSSSSCSGGMGNIITSTTPTVGSVITTDQTKDRSFYDTGGFAKAAADAATAVAASVTDGGGGHQDEIKESGVKVYSQDEIWDDIETLSEDDVIKPVDQFYGGGGNSEYYSGRHDKEMGTGCSSPVWDYFPVSSLWMTGDHDHEENNNYNYNSFYNNQDYMMSFNEDDSSGLQVLI